VVEAPNVPPLELKTAMRWRIKDLLDFHIDDATIDVMDIPPDKSGSSRAHSMYAVAARNSAIERRVKTFDSAKIPLEVIDIPEMAQRNIAARLEESGRGLALISFSEEAGLLTVTYQGELYLARHLDIGWQQLATGDHDAKQAHFERITLELQRSLDNIERQYPFISISRLHIAYMSAAEALRTYLANNLSVATSILDLNDVFDFSRVPAVGALNNQVRFFLTLGASLRREERAL
jgi:MSHA biogenesis protein MshI